MLSMLWLIAFHKLYGAFLPEPFRVDSFLRINQSLLFCRHANWRLLGLGFIGGMVWRSGFRLLLLFLLLLSMLEPLLKQNSFCYQTDL
jgi:hypothetical protein